MEEQLITVKRCTYPWKLSVLQSFMDMKGGEYFIKNLTLNQLSFPLGEIEMQVRSSDYVRAKEALIEGGFSKPEDFPAENV